MRAKEWLESERASKCRPRYLSTLAFRSCQGRAQSNFLSAPYLQTLDRHLNGRNVRLLKSSCGRVGSQSWAASRMIERQGSRSCAEGRAISRPRCPPRPSACARTIRLPRRAAHRTGRRAHCSFRAASDQ